jgi:GNAT superfamily N-acetyltransferase
MVRAWLARRAHEGGRMNLTALTEAVLTQRQERMTDVGPSLRGVGSARYQLSGGTLMVGYAQVRPGKADELIDRVNRYARDRWLAVQWTYTHGQDDPQIEAALVGRRYTLRETLRLMGKVGELTPPPQPLPHVTAAPVSTMSQMQAYERVSSWSFGHQPNPSLDHLLVRGRERWDEQQARWYQYYLGYLNGEPVSGAYISLWERVPTIYGVATLPAARQQGVAGQVLRYLVHETLLGGYEWTCLYVALGNPAENLYRSLGFTTLLEQSTYHWGDPRW